MKKIDLGQTITILANVGVIGGLIFVGLQLRQDRQIAITESVTATVNGRIAWSESLAANDEIWVRGLADEPLTDAEQARFDALAAAHELYYFNNWNRNVSIGSAYSEQRWIREIALDVVTYPGLARWWQRHVTRLSQTDPEHPSAYILEVTGEIERFQTERR